MSAILPPLGAVANVSIIDTTSRIGGINASHLLVPTLKGFDKMPIVPAWSFLIVSGTGEKILFDLGVPKDFENMSPVIRARLKSFGWSIEAPKSVGEILEENGVAKTEIGAVIWR
jgi:hypothetical protein